MVHKRRSQLSTTENRQKGLLQGTIFAVAVAALGKGCFSPAGSFLVGL